MKIIPSPTEKYKAWAVAVFACLLQFLYLPFFANINDGAKGFAFVLVTLILASLCLRPPPIFIPSVVPIFVLLILWLFLATFFVPFAADAVIAVAFLTMGLLYLVVVTDLARKVPAFRTFFLNSLMVAGVAGAALGLYQFVAYIDGGAPSSMLIPYLLPPGGTYGLRCTGVYGQPNLFAHFLVLSLLSFTYRYLHRDEFIADKSEGWARLVPVTLIGVVFFLTQSRAGLIDLGVVYAFIGYLVLKGKYCVDTSWRRKEFLLIILSLVGAWALAKEILHFVSLSDSLTVHGTLAQTSDGQVDHGESSYQRLLFLVTSVLVFRAHPWVGVGLDNFKSYLASYQVPALKLLHLEYSQLGQTRWVHNEFLQLLAEGGCVAFLLALTIVFLYFSSLRRYLKSSRCDSEPSRLYAYLFILPFLVQALFSWPLRYPGMFVLFLTCLALLLAPGPGRTVQLYPVTRIAGGILLFFAFVTTALLIRHETRIVHLRQDLQQVGPQSATMEQFTAMAVEPYSRYVVLRKGLPTLVNQAVEHQDVWLANRLIPYARELTAIEGTYWEWYNLSRLYDLGGSPDEAMAAINTAIDRNPGYDPSWYWKHYLNLKTVAKNTGVPLTTLQEQGRRGMAKLLDSKNGKMLHDRVRTK